MSEARFVEAINQALDQALQEDERVVLLGEDIADPAGGIVGATRGLSTKHGADRVRETPISEQAIAGAAVGAGIDGLLPVAEIMIMDFFTIALDQVVNHAAKLRYTSGGRTTAPVTIRTAIFSGSGAGATHAQSLEGWLAHVPGLKVVFPSTPYDAKGLLTSCIFDEDPCVFIEHTRLLPGKGEVPEESYRVPLGEAAVRREGSDVTLLTYGRPTADVLTAAEQLAEEGIEAEVVDLRTLMPLDLTTVLDSVRRTRRAVVVHDATQFLGYGAELAARISNELFGELAAPVERLGAPYTPIPAGALESSMYPTPDAVAATARKTVKA